MATSTKNMRYRYGQVGRWAFWFKAYGTFMDHLLAHYGTLAFLVEISRQYPGRIPVKRLANPLAWFNPPGNEIEMHAEDVRNMLGALVTSVMGSKPNRDGSYF
jgi:hypothetical protein